MADGCREKIDFSFFMCVILNGRTKKRKAFFHRIEKEQFEKTKVFNNRRQMKQYLKEINYKDA
jgi:hypothetical protein